ncbi:MAG: ornithine carbamoyltransferase [Candidatus Bipolaricaulis sp.]|nr:ornithine carbamoyltransferase [Candidatus Bipolaricaulis sp.]MDD5220041.1 ornithine carbamoyltransferase [Candidatus Bipolaricaulis sp.]MDD5646504.1 ornithine carbamoyltransferase [Candidatus Bipolaricaulis sp.]
MNAHHVVSIGGLSSEEVFEILEVARNLKLEHRAGIRHTMLEGKTLAMIFQKPSLRTRVSFEAGMEQLGGHAIYLGPSDIKLGERETTEDIALNLSRFVDGIMARVFKHETILELAKHATVPVINGLCDLHHPCQALADLLTVWEKKRSFEGLTLTFIGDGNNVAHSLIEGCARVGMAFRIACPKGYEPDGKIVAAARAQGASVEVLHDPREAASGADVLYTDVWVSMGQETEAKSKQNAFDGFTIDKRLLAAAKKDAIIMHCLPAHYDEEITYEASRSPGSAIFDQAENRMHAQKAVMALLMK